MIVSGLALSIAIAGAQPMDAAAIEGTPILSVAPVAMADPIPAEPDAVTILEQEPADDAPEAANLDDAQEPDGPPADDGAVTEGEAIIVTGALEAPKGDPAEELNAATYQAVQAVDSAVVEPIAMAYDKALPGPLRDGVGNFLSNLGEPVSFINHLLQFKFGKAFKTLGRFAINSTLGIGGLFDHASKKPFNIEKERNGLANTLGFYGIGPGPYLYLPLIGPTTVRDLIGRFADLSVVPTIAGKPFNSPYYALPLGAMHSLEDRIELDGQIDAIRTQCGDPYAATRDLYLIQRQVEIDRLRGRVRANLGEIQDRLEFNCDIEIETGFVPDDAGKTFVESRTNLIKDETDATEAEPAEPTTEPDVVETLEPSDEAVQPETTPEEEPVATEPVG